MDEWAMDGQQTNVCMGGQMGGWMDGQVMDGYFGAWTTSRRTDERMRHVKPCQLP